MLESLLGLKGDGQLRSLSRSRSFEAGRCTAVPMEEACPRCLATPSDPMFLPLCLCVRVWCLWRKAAGGSKTYAPSIKKAFQILKLFMILIFVEQRWVSWAS